MLRAILINSKGNLNRFFSISKNSGKEMFYPKYGNSFYEPGQKLPDEKKKSREKIEKKNTDGNKEENKKEEN